MPRGQTLSLKDFQGQGSRNYTDSLPTQSRGGPREDRRAGGRFDDDSRSNNSGAWRAGGGGGAGGEDTFGRSDDVGNWRSGGGGGRSKMGGGGFGGSSRQGGGGGFGGGGGGGFGGGGGRPGHKRLQLSRKGEGGASGPARFQQSQQQGGELAPKRRVAVNKQKRVTARDDFDGKSTITLDQRETKLIKAMRNKVSVDLKQLEKGLKKVNLEDEYQSQDLSIVMGLSLKEKRLFLADVCQCFEVDMVVTVLKGYVSKFGEKASKQLVKDSGVDLMAKICPGMSDEDRDAFLLDNGIICLAPIPENKLRSGVSKALDSASSQEVLDLIKGTVDDKISVADTLSEPVCAYVVKSIFAVEGSADLSVLDSHMDLLKRVLSDETSQKELLSATQKKWFEKKQKGVIKQIYQKLHADKVVTPESFVAWKEDRSDKSKSKMKVLVQVMSWLVTIEPQPEEEYSDEDEGDDEEEDDLMPNY